jgi:UDP-2-acetamido-3-amino-2,3-dideoxy-glucuronate N-acetyltransferase
MNLFSMNSQQSLFIHPQSLVEEGVTIGARTRVWAFAHLVSGAVIGQDCNICDQTFVEGKVVVGDRVTLKCGVYLWDGLILEDDVFVGPAAVFTNDVWPRSRHKPHQYAKTLLKTGCSIGANATVLPGLIIGQWAMVAAGAVVTRSVPDFALVIGNPGRVCGWVCRCGKKLGAFSDGEALCKCGLCYGIKPDQTIKEKSDVA